MFGIGFFEVLIIALVLFIAFGPEQLPALMRKLASYYRQMNNLKDELKFQIMSADSENYSEQKAQIKEDKDHG